MLVSALVHNLKSKSSNDFDLIGFQVKTEGVLLIPILFTEASCLKKKGKLKVVCFKI